MPDNPNNWWQSARAGTAAVNKNFSKWGAGTFAKHYATGGLISRSFPVEGMRMERTFFGLDVQHGSPAYMRNLRRMQAQGGRIGEAAEDVLSKTTPASMGKRIMGRVSRGVFGPGLAAAVPAMAIPGDTGDRIGHAVAGLGSEAGWHLGGIMGSAIGGTVGGPIGGFVGGVAGRFIGAAAGWAGAGEMFKPIKNLAERGKKARLSNWVQDTSAFTTRKAKTMRQASLQMMNTGMMTARSGLGHEGVMFHR